MAQSVAQTYLERLQERAYMTKGLAPNEVLKKIQDDRRDMRSFVEQYVQSQNTTNNTVDVEKMRAQLLDQLEQMEKIKTPTKYENPQMYSLVLKMMEGIEVAAREMYFKTDDGEKSFEDLAVNMKRPLYGTMPLGQVNAMAVPVTGSDVHLVIFDSNLIIHCNLLSKIVSKEPCRKHQLLTIL
jgi:hypothetical protein